LSSRSVLLRTGLLLRSRGALVRASSPLHVSASRLSSEVDLFFGTRGGLRELSTGSFRLRSRLPDARGGLRAMDLDLDRLV
nr:hypothetical protein [Tanacetum cinerariifolium]